VDHPHDTFPLPLYVRTFFSRSHFPPFSPSRLVFRVQTSGSVTATVLFSNRVSVVIYRPPFFIFPCFAPVPSQEKFSPCFWIPSPRLLFLGTKDFVAPLHCSPSSVTTSCCLISLPPRGVRLSRLFVQEEGVFLKTSICFAHFLIALAPFSLFKEVRLLPPQCVDGVLTAFQVMIFLSCRDVSVLSVGYRWTNQNVASSLYSSSSKIPFPGRSPLQFSSVLLVLVFASYSFSRDSFPISFAR